MTDPEVISVVIVPEAKYLKYFYKISEELDGSLLTLSKTYIPHITIAQFIAKHNEIALLKDELFKIDGGKLSFVVDGMTIAPDFDHSQSWIELLVLKNLSISKLQKQVLETSFANQHKIHSKVGDLFRPHITVGLLDGANQLPEFDIETLQPIKGVAMQGIIRIGRNGAHFTFLG